MITLKQIKLKLTLERLVIGVEEPILIKGAGEFSAKVDSGNGGYNVIHGEDLYANGDILVFTTFNKDGERRSLSKKIQSYIEVNIGGGHIEKRPVVLLNIKFADEDYKQVPFSVTNRASQKNKVLICKDFISNELGALIDPSMENIADKGIEANLTGEEEIVKEGVGKLVTGTLGAVKDLTLGAPRAVQRFSAMNRAFSKGERGALTNYIQDEVEQLKKATTDKYKGLFGNGKGKKSKEYEKFEKNEAEKKNIQTKHDPKQARVQAQNENIPQLTGVEGATANSNRIFGIMDYEGYLGDGKDVVSSQKDVRKNMKEYLAAREALLQQEQQPTQQPVQNQNESYIAEETTVDFSGNPNVNFSQEAQNNNPSVIYQTASPQVNLAELEKKALTPYDLRNYFRFNFMSFYNEEDKKAPDRIEAEFKKFITSHRGELENLGNQFFSTLGNKPFSPNQTAAVTFVNGVKNLIEAETDLNGVFFVAYGSVEERELTFFKQNNLIIKESEQNRKRLVKNLVREFKQKVNKWMNDSYLRGLPLRIPSYPNEVWTKEITQNPEKAFIKLRKDYDLPIPKNTKQYKYTDDSAKILKDVVAFARDFKTAELRKIEKDMQEVYKEALKQFTPYTPPKTAEATLEEWSKTYQALRREWENNPILWYQPLDIVKEDIIKFVKMYKGLNNPQIDNAKEFAFKLRFPDFVEGEAPEDYEFSDGDIDLAKRLLKKVINLIQEMLDYTNNGNREPLENDMSKMFPPYIPHQNA